MDKVAHFEIPADDMERAKKFYSETFGWDVQFFPQYNYSFVITTPVDQTTMMPKEVGAVNGGMLKRQEPIKHPVITINVKDMNKALASVKKHGGKVIKEQFPVGDMGLSAYIKDTEGNIIGVWQSLKH